MQPELEMTPAVGTVILGDNYVPSLPLSSTNPTVFNITATLTLGNVPSDAPQNPITVTQSFTIQDGPRFVMPKSYVYTVDPAISSQGDFSATLPQIVITDPHMPWIRPFSTTDQSIPWLALVVAGPTDLQQLTPVPASSTYNSDGSYTIPTASIPTSFPSSSTTISAAQFPTGTTLPTAGAEDTCRMIFLQKALFAALFPSASSTKYFATTRNINTGSALLDGLTQNGYFSVICANRLPPSGSTIVHLVSLEGMNGYFTTTPPSTNPTVGLISLYSWNFTSTVSSNETFTSQLSNITSGISSTSVLARSPSLTNPANANTTNPLSLILTNANNRLSCGYVPVQYQVMTGEATIAWYRGPLIPGAPPSTSNFPSTSNPRHSSAYMLYDSLTGMFDVTYSVAWQLGRGLALQDKIYFEALMEYRRSVHDLTLQVYKGQATSTVTSNNKLTNTLQNTKTNFYTSFGVLTATMANTSGNTYIALPGANPPPHHNLLTKRTTTNSTGVSTPAIYFSRQYPTIPPSGSIFSNCLSSVLSMYASSATAVTSNLTNQNLDYILQWLNQLSSLSTVPSHYMIPDPQMLPAESLKFFGVDPNWILALVDGALSIGYSPIDSAVRTNLKKLLTSYQQSNTPSITPMFGFCLRSKIVTNNPGLIISPNATVTPPSSANPMISPVRRPGSDILQCFFQSIPGTQLSAVTIGQPPEQFHFGFYPPFSSGNAAVMKLRSTTTSVPTGSTVTYADLTSNPPPGTPAGTSPVLNTNYNTINGSALATFLISKMAIQTITPWQCILQLIPPPSASTIPLASASS